MSGYLTTGQVEATIAYLAARFSSFCSLMPLAESSVEGRAIHALRIRGGSSGDRRGVLLLGGVHARELINPDLLCSWVIKLCHAYQDGTGITFGPTTYPTGTVKLLVESLDLFVVPLVNPDGRVFVQAGQPNRMWRKNRSANQGQPCRGVDLNRNYDFLFSSGIGTSTSACDDVFRGPTAFSEPETRNVRSLLNAHPHIVGLADVHSYSELILYPWGDDDNQTTNPAQNFSVPDPKRGIPNDGLYREYIPAPDLDWYVRTSNRMRDAIAAVRGRMYTVQQSVGLYPTTATVDDYAYARSFVDPALRTVLALTIETSAKPVANDYLGAFQPPYSEAQQVIIENGPALVEFCLAVLCAAEELLRSADATLLAALRRMTLRLTESEGGRELHGRLLTVSPDVLMALAQRPRVRARAGKVLERLGSLALEDDDFVFDRETLAELRQVAASIRRSVPVARPLLDELDALVAGAQGLRLSDVLRATSAPARTATRT